MPAWLQPNALPFLVIIACVTIAVLSWTIIRLPVKFVDCHKKNKIPYRAIVTQGLWVTLSCLCVLLMVVGVLNRANDWYPTWKSMSFNVKLAEVETHSTSQLQPQKPQPWEEYEPTAEQANFVPDDYVEPSAKKKITKGTYISVDIPSENSGYSFQKTTIWLPPSYKTHPKRHYPVILALHGYPNGPQVYRNVLEIDSKVTNLVNQHMMREAIVVMPIVFPNNVDTECVDAADGSFNVETYLIDDVLPWVHTHLRTAKDRQAWATFGYSAGGWCASMLSVRHPDKLPHSINLSGYFRPDFSQGALLRSSDHSYDLPTIVERKKDPIQMYFWSAKDDRISMKALSEFKSHVKEPTVLTHSLIEAGGHSWPVWHRGSVEGLQWLGRYNAHFAWVK